MNVVFPTTQNSVVQFQGDTPSVLGSNLEELLRHVTSLRQDGVEMVLTIFKTLCKLGGHSDEKPVSSC